MSEKAPNSSPSSSASERLEAWDTNKSQAATSDYYDIALGGAGVTDFSDEARQRIQEQAAYDEYMQKFAPSGDEDVYRGRRDVVEGARLDVVADSKHMAEVDAGIRLDFIDRQIDSSPKLRFALSLAKEVNKLYSETSGDSDNNAAYGRFTAKFDSLLKRLEEYSDSDNLAPGILDRILSVAEAEPVVTNSSQTPGSVDAQEPVMTDDEVAGESSTREILETSPSLQAQVTEAVDGELGLLDRMLNGKDRLQKMVLLYSKREALQNRRITRLQAQLEKARAKNPNSNRTKQLARQLRWQRMVLENIQKAYGAIDSRIAGRFERRSRVNTAKEAKKLLMRELGNIKKDMKEKRKRMRKNNTWSSIYSKIYLGEYAARIEDALKKHNRFISKAGDDETFRAFTGSPISTDELAPDDDDTPDSGEHAGSDGVSLSASEDSDSSALQDLIADTDRDRELKGELLARQQQLNDDIDKIEDEIRLVLKEGLAKHVKEVLLPERKKLIGELRGVIDALDEVRFSSSLSSVEVAREVGGAATSPEVAAGLNASPELTDSRENGVRLTKLMGRVAVVALRLARAYLAKPKSSERNS